MIVATAGHIDHGKTALVKALTGVDTDRLPEEKARGISIDLGFAYWKTPGDATIGFVDVPGHERFVRNMLAGVCAIDYVLLVIAADDGIMPQTREHLHIIDLLSVSRGIAVITKTDRVPSERVNQVMSEVRALLEPTALDGIEILPVSALTGEGIGKLREILSSAVEQHGHRENTGRNFRYAVDRVFTVPGSGTVVTGTVFNGLAAVGDRVTLSPSGIKVRIRGIQIHGQPASHASAGERCAINLSGVELEDVRRGDWVLAPSIHAPTQRIDVRLRLLATEAQGLKHWTSLHLHLATAEVLARVAIQRGASVAPGESARVQLILDKPVAALNGDRFIIRDQSARRTIGGGVVIDPFPPAQHRNRELRAAQLLALEHGDPAGALRALLAVSPAGVNLEHFTRTFNLAEDHLETRVRELDLIVIDKEPPVGLSPASVDAVRQNVLETLAHFHHEAPQALGIEILALRERSAPAITGSTFTILLRKFADEKNLALTGSLARLPKHVATANSVDERIWQKLKPLLGATGFKGQSVSELATAVSLKKSILEDFLHRKARSGEVIRIAPERFYLRETLAQLAAVAQAASQSEPGEQFTAAQFRDLSGLGRTLAIEILECLDRLGITQRIGDVRKMRKDFVPILGPASAPSLTTARPVQPVSKPSQRTKQAGAMVRIKH